ncbi:MAG: prolipoprotein diacylglyceryl transferase [Clostridiales bacterium]|nr:prolipoprotein diacylglyceryl transferase [Clostridiales bacterium]
MDQFFSFTSYGIFAALALLLGIIGACLHVRRARKCSLDVLLTYAVVIIPSVWLFSRLVFVLANCTYYLTTLSNPVLALHFWDGGYSMIGAFCGACFGAWLTGKITHLSSRIFLDGVGIGFPLAVIAARLAEIGTGLGEGRPITGSFIPPLAPEGLDGPLHPIFLYEALCALIILSILLCLTRSHHHLPHEGDLLLIEMTLYGVTQVLLESLKDDGHMVVHFVRIQQVLASVLIVISMIIWSRRLHSHKRDILTASVITIISIALAILAEFGVDRWGNRLLAYGLMVLCLIAILSQALHLYHLTFREESANGSRKN